MSKSAKMQSLLIAMLALAIGITTYLYLTTLSSRANSEGNEQNVYVATSEIPAGTSFEKMLQESLIQIRSFPANSLSSGIISTKDSIQSTAVNSSEISAGQLIFEAMFSTPQKFASGLNIPQDKLAITISVDEVSRVANFVAPGSRVVIYSTGISSKRGEAITKLLVSDALVLAVGNQIVAPNLGSQVAPSSLVTLAVEPTIVDLILHAGQNSKLTLALAHANDPSSIDLPKVAVSNSAIFGGN